MMDISKFRLNSLQIPARYRAVVSYLRHLDGYDGTVAFLAGVDPEEFFETRSVGHEKVRMLREMQELLPKWIHAYLKDAGESECFEWPLAGTHEQSSIYTGEREDSPSPGELSEDDRAIPFERLPLSTARHVLVRNLARIPDFDGTCGFILDIEPTQFCDLPGVGKLKESELLEVQKAIPGEIAHLNLTPQSVAVDPKQTKPQLPEPDRGIPFEQLHLSIGKEVLLRNLARLPGFDGTCGFVMSLEPARFQELTSVGRLKSGELVEVQKAIPGAIAELRSNSKPVSTADVSSQPVLTADVEWDCSQLDDAIATSFAEFLAALSNRDRRIARNRFWNSSKTETLKLIGSEFGVSESRMSQVSTELEKKFTQRLRVVREKLRSQLASSLTVKLENQFPQLSDIFQSPADFFAMLERVSGLPKGAVSEQQLVPGGRQYRDVLDCLMTSNAAPIDPRRFLELVSIETGLIPLLCTRVIDSWVGEGLISLDRDGVQPGDLSIPVLITAELVKHPNGLPWLDLTRILNHRHPDLKLSETDKDGAIRARKDVYVVGRSVFRHRSFMNVAVETRTWLLEAVREYLEDRPDGRARLDGALEAIESNERIEYYDARDVIANFGKEVGIYFEGRSRSDSIALKADSTRVSAAERILRILSEAQTPLSVRDVESRLERSRGSALQTALASLVEQGAIIQVSRGHFQTAEAVLESVDVGAIEDGIRRLVSADSRPLEADVLRVALNRDLGLGRTKFFYRSICDRMAEAEGWDIARSIVGVSPLPFRSIQEMLALVYQEGMEVDTLIEAGRERIRMTPGVATRLVTAWLKSLLAEE